MTTQTTLSGPAAGRDGGARIINGDYKTTSGPGPAIMDANTLTGDTVVNAAGEDLGKIEAIMLDVGAGRIAYAVLSFGGFLGMGAKLFALPWAALTLDAREKRFVLDASKEKLENAEGFDKDSWPRMADPEWAARVHTYYGVTPYWHQEFVASPDPRRSTLSQQFSEGADRTMKY